VFRFHCRNELLKSRGAFLLTTLRNNSLKSGEILRKLKRIVVRKKRYTAPKLRIAIFTPTSAIHRLKLKKNCFKNSRHDSLKQRTDLNRNLSQTEICPKTDGSYSNYVTLYHGREGHDSVTPHLQGRVKGRREGSKSGIFTVT